MQVCWDNRLNFEQNHPPMDYLTPPVAQNPTKDYVSVGDIKQHFVNYLRNNNLGMIDNTWLAFCDISNQGALDADAIELARLHSLAVDFPKSGVPVTMDRSAYKIKEYPDFMEKALKPSYPSKKAIGEVYRSVLLETCQGLLPYPKEPQPLLFVEGYEAFMDEAKEICAAYARDLYSLMRQCVFSVSLTSINSLDLPSRASTS